MMLKRLMMIAVMALMTLVANPAAAQLSGVDYGVHGVRSAQGVQEGQVVDVVDSVVTTEASASSRIIGATLGGAVCGRMTEHWNSWMAQAAVMTACAAAGERVSSGASTDRAQAQTFIVRVSGGGTIAVTQVDPGIRRGQRVYVLTGQGTRIVRAGV